jgi:hypothetical protein
MKELKMKVPANAGIKLLFAHRCSGQEVQDFTMANEASEINTWRGGKK